MNEVTDKERIENELLETNEHWSRLYPRMMAVIEREGRLAAALRFYAPCERCEGGGDEPHTDNDVIGPAPCRECDGMGQGWDRGRRAQEVLSDEGPPSAMRDAAGNEFLDDAATYGTGFQKGGQRIDPREVYDTPPQRRDALEVLDIAERSLSGEANLDGRNCRIGYITDRQIATLRRHLTAPPTVPEAVRRLPEEWRNRYIPGAEAGLSVDELARVFALELDRALAQHSEPGRVPEDTARLDKLERLGDPGVPWIARQSSQGRGYRLHQSLSHAAVQPTVREAIDAAPEPDNGEADGRKK